MSDETSETFPKSSELFGNVRDAALAYGCSERTLLNWIASDKIEATREGKQWRVRLPVPSETVSESAAETSESLPKVSETISEPLPNALEALVEQQSSEIAFLRARIEEHEAVMRRRDEADGEMRRLLLTRDREVWQLREQLAITAALVENEKLSPSSPVSTDVPAGGTETALSATHSDGIAERGETLAGPRMAWWKRLFGRKEG